MRYCPNCRRINEDWPDRCRFCGLTWSVRICRRGHLNPTNAVFCGECGSGDLTNTALGGEFINAIFGLFQGKGPLPFLSLFIKLTFPLFILYLIDRNYETLLPLIVGIVILILALRFTIGQMPSWLTKRVGKYYRNRIKDYKNRAGRRDSRGK